MRNRLHFLLDIVSANLPVTAAAALVALACQGSSAPSRSGSPSTAKPGAPIAATAPSIANARDAATPAPANAPPTTIATAAGTAAPQPPPGPPPGERGTLLSLVYSGNGQGEIEPCG